MLRMIPAAWILAGAVLAAPTVDGHVVNAVTGTDVPRATVIIHPAEIESLLGLAARITVRNNEHTTVE